MKWTLLILVSPLFFMSCHQPLPIDYQPEVQGHRGCRGLMPENTIEGFIHAIDLGVHTLELDVVVSRDSQVVVSHEPFFNHLISLAPPEYDSISATNEKEYNIYQMDYAEISTFDVGSKLHPKYPLQTKINTYKPTLAMVVDTIEKYITTKKLAPVRYNIEIKHQDSTEGSFHPDAQKMVTWVYNEIHRLQLKTKSTVQCFNPRCLNILHEIDPNIKTVLLIENTETYEKNLEKLTFKPDIYSPHFLLINQKLINYCKSQNIKVIPWTVNEEKEIKQMLFMRVDGIISDYPDKVIEIIAELR